MEKGILYHIIRQHLVPEDHPESMYNRHFYNIEVYEKKDNGLVIHAKKTKKFTIIPEKDKHILVPSECRLRELPQTIENYDKTFDKNISSFLDSLDESSKNKGCYKIFSFNLKDKYILPFVEFEVYCKFCDFHFEKLNPSDSKIQLCSNEFRDIKEFLNLLNQGTFNLYSELECLIIERKLSKVI